jgi:Rad3-related DNA helicase
VSKIPNPVECGLPEKFTAWRPQQEHAIEAMKGATKRVTALSAPTGFGKSPAYVAHALLSGLPTCIITNSRGLQTQLMNDYASIGMVDIRGKSNYQCGMRDDYTCQEGGAARCPFKGSMTCPASQAEARATGARLVVTNYDKWISCSRQTDNWMAHFSQIILDEGHDAPDALAKHMSFVITPEDVEKVLQMRWPMSTENIGSWKGWATVAREVAEEKIIEWRYKLENELSPKVSWIKAAEHVKKLWKRLCVISTCRPSNWVVDEVQNGFQFDPIRPGQYAEGILLLQVPRVVIVSATLRPKTLWMLGLGTSQYDFREFDSDFDRNRCPIYYVPTMRIDVKAKDLSALWVKLDQIMSRRSDRKGIIHTISYARRDDILAHSRYRKMMMVNPQGELASDSVERFKAADPGTVLVSPSVSTGYDFPGRDCEWQFMCKIPFGDGRAKIHKARQEADPEYGAYSAMQTMVQAFGRGMRSREDQCENFICDSHLDWFIPRYRHLAPKSFHQHFRRVENVPAPPPALGV